MTNLCNTNADYAPLFAAGIYTPTAERQALDPTVALNSTAAALKALAKEPAFRHDIAVTRDIFASAMETTKGAPAREATARRTLRRTTAPALC